MFPVSGMLTFNLFPTILVFSRSIDGRWCENTVTSFRSPVLGLGQSPPYMFSTLLLRIWAGDGPEKWRKIGDYKEDLRGIPACEAEIGNWAVVITGCGIDVVRINQNCWINKNCSRFFIFYFFYSICHGPFQKMLQSLCPLPLLTVFQYLQQMVGKILVLMHKVRLSLFFLC